jgi:Nucleotide modification associated domain 3
VIPLDVELEEVQQMKIILSRKGFDSESGGCASPIFEDNSFLSLPIPDPSARLRFSDIGGNQSVGTIVQDLTGGRKKALTGSDRVHLDPDLSRDSLPRKSGWRPLFGQAGIAQNHLDRNGVGRGDIFLFFGWFRRVEQRNGKLRYKAGAPDLHVFFGWLEVGDVWRLPADRCRIPEWADSHPHVTDQGFVYNTIYVAAGSDRTYHAGVFRSFTEQLILTRPDQSLRSRWQLPKWFHPAGKKSTLSFHPNLSKWKHDEKYAYLESVGRGQEFVLDTSEYPEAEDWARCLISDNS